MGRCYLFQCPRCGFGAKVSGGDDEGFNCCTRTIVCQDCQQLFDVATRVRVASLSAGAQARLTQAAERGASPIELKTLLPPHVSFSRTSIAPSFAGVGLAERRHPKWIQLKIECPVARHHRVEQWSNPGKCPRCQTYLDRTLMPYRIWD